MAASNPHQSPTGSQSGSNQALLSPRIARRGTSSRTSFCRPRKTRRPAVAPPTSLLSECRHLLCATSALASAHPARPRGSTTRQTSSQATSRAPPSISDYDSHGVLSLPPHRRTRRFQRSPTHGLAPRRSSAGVDRTGTPRSATMRGSPSRRRSRV
jgi:hypothetical protein